MRGSIDIWISPEAIGKWQAETQTNKHGAHTFYSSHAIETVLTVRSVMHLPLRQSEGFVRSVFEIMKVNLPVPDHTTVSRRSKELPVIPQKCASSGPITILIDSTGLKTFDAAQWRDTKKGPLKMRDRVKLHIGLDADSRKAVAEVLTTNDVGDSTMVPELLDQVSNDIDILMADGAYDAQHIYETANSFDARSIIPLRKTAVLSRNGPGNEREEQIELIRKLGRCGWEKATGYNTRSLVENFFYRYKMIIAGKLRSRCFANQETEARIGVKILNQMTELGMPISVRC